MNHIYVTKWGVIEVVTVRNDGLMVTYTMYGTIKPVLAYYMVVKA